MHATANVDRRWTVLDCDRELMKTASIDELDEALRDLPQLARTPNTIVNLIAPGGDTLSVGVAQPNSADNATLKGPLACVNFVSRDRNPPYLSVVGDPSMTFDKDGVIVFRYEEGTWTEIPRRNCVTPEIMRRIVRHFFDHQKLPDWIPWEEI